RRARLRRARPRGPRLPVRDDRRRRRRHPAGCTVAASSRRRERTQCDARAVVGRIVARFGVEPAALAVGRAVPWETSSMALRPFVLVASAVLAVALGASPCARQAQAYGRDLTGSIAPELYVSQGLYGLSSGASLASMRGHPVVLKFFFTHCPACRASLPE